MYEDVNTWVLLGSLLLLILIEILQCLSNTWLSTGFLPDKQLFVLTNIGTNSIRIVSFHKSRIDLSFKNWAPKRVTCIFGTSGPVVFYFYYWPSYVSFDKWIYKVNMILIYSWNYYYFCQIAIYQRFSSTDSVSKLYPLAQPSIIIWKQVFVFINDNWHRSKLFKQSHYIFGCFKLIRKNNRILQTRETTWFCTFCISLKCIYWENFLYRQKTGPHRLLRAPPNLWILVVK